MEGSSGQPEKLTLKFFLRGGKNTNRGKKFLGERESSHEERRIVAGDTSGRSAERAQTNSRRDASDLNSVEIRSVIVIIRRYPSS